MRYKNDCKELYGRILGSQNVVSFTQASCKKQTEEIWSRMYPCEPYELNLSTQISEDSGNNVLGAQKSTNYDLVSAVKRQSSFYYQVMEKFDSCKTIYYHIITRFWLRFPKAAFLPNK